MATARLHLQHSVGLPSCEHVTGALEAILSSRDFQASERNKKFLAYIVDETLAGRAERLKGYNIAVEVFGRDPSFDSQADPLVRIEAGRLRRSLERYYLTAGRTDQLRISVPKGGYVPVFERVIPEPPVVLQSPPNTRRYANRSARRKAWMLAAGLAALVGIGTTVLSIYPVPHSVEVPPLGPAQPYKAGPSLLVQPFSNLSNDPAEDYFASGLNEELIAAVTRFKSVKVFAGTSGEGGSGDSSDTSAQGAGIDYILKGSVRKLRERFRVTVRLMDAPTGGQLWTETYDRKSTSDQFLDVQSDIAGRIAETLGHPYNVLFTHETKRVAAAGSKSFEAYDCVLKIYAYWETLSPGRHRELRDCHELAVITAPAYTDAWVNLAWLYIDEQRFDYNRSTSARPPLDRAADAARNAIALEPDNARAHLVMAIVHWFRQDFRAFDQEAELALSLNENDTTVAAELGMRFSLRGDWERARPLLDRALARTPFKPHLYRTAYSLHAYGTGDYTLALEEAGRTGLADHPVIQLLETAIYGQMGRTSEAREAWQSIRAKSPRMTDEPRFWMLSRGLFDSYVDSVMEGLDKAGVLRDE